MTQSQPIRDEIPRWVWLPSMMYHR